jgi:hypothetical protein
VNRYLFLDGKLHATYHVGCSEEFRTEADLERYIGNYCAWIGTVELRTAPNYQPPCIEVDKECPRCGGSGREVLEGDSSSVKILCRHCVGVPSRKADEEEDSETEVEEVHEPAPDPNCGRCKGTGFTKYRSRGKDWEYRCRCWR